MPTSFADNRPVIMDLIKRENPKRIIEMGIGWGIYGKMIREALPNVTLIGIEIWRDYRNRRWGNYDEIWLGDIRNYDYEATDCLYLLVDVLEHLSKEDGLRLLDSIHGDMIISCPINYPQKGLENPYEDHLSEWRVSDFLEYEIENYSNSRSVIVLLRRKK